MFGAHFPGMNPDIEEMPGGAALHCYNGYQALNFAWQWDESLKGIKGNFLLFSSFLFYFLGD